MTTSDLSPTAAAAAATAATPDTGPAILRPLRIRDFRLLFAAPSLAGFAWGVPSLMVWPDEEAA